MTDEEIQIMYNNENFIEGHDIYRVLTKEEIDKLRAHIENQKTFDFVSNLINGRKK